MLKLCYHIFQMYFKVSKYEGEVTVLIFFHFFHNIMSCFMHNKVGQIGIRIWSNGVNVVLNPLLNPLFFVIRSYVIKLYVLISESNSYFHKLYWLKYLVAQLNNKGTGFDMSLLYLIVIIMLKLFI